MKFRVDCCFGCQAMEDGNPMVASAGGWCWLLVGSFSIVGLRASFFEAVTFV